MLGCRRAAPRRSPIRAGASASASGWPPCGWATGTRSHHRTAPQPCRARRAQRGASGTRCSWPAFTRSPGIVQIAPARSVSARRAPRTSAERAVVRTRNSNASRCWVGAGAAYLRERDADLGVRQRPLVLGRDAVAGQRGGDLLARRVVRRVAFGDGEPGGDDLDPPSPRRPSVRRTSPARRVELTLERTRSRSTGHRGQAAAP